MDLFESVIKPRHYCNIYRSSDDLQKTIAEYFKTGLKKNELCICITSDDLTEMGLKKAMQKNGIAFESAISAGKLEIHHYKTWYLNDGVFDKGRVLKAWEDKILKALGKETPVLTITLRFLVKNSFSDRETPMNFPKKSKLGSLNFVFSFSPFLSADIKKYPFLRKILAK